MKNKIALIDQQLNWSSLPDIVHHTLQQTLTIQQIPAPSFNEAERAAYVQGQFEQYGLHDVRIDSVYNVYGRLPSANPTQPALMISAHTDTVFPAETDLAQREEPGRIYGPGIGDNSVSVGALMGLLYAITQQKLSFARDIWFVATSCEEGLGDLRGMKHAYAALKDQIDCVLNLEGLSFGHIYHAGIASRRLHITATANGGHSWLHFGRKSAVHAIMELGYRIIHLKVPKSPRTTYNIGLIEGGQGINVIGTEAGLWLDLRSEDQQTLLQLEQHVRNITERLTDQEITFQIEVVGDRPAGAIPTSHDLVQQAQAVLTYLGEKTLLETGSTDANVPLSDACPAVTIGITRGSNAHRLDEYIETEPITQGMKQFILLTTLLAGQASMKPA